MNDTNTTSLLAQLAQPFAPEHMTWKPGSTTRDGNKCMALAYADLRAYQDRLDAVCGLDWSVEYQPWGNGRIIAKLTIQGVTRASTGEMDAQDEKSGIGGTVAEAQAFKRAAAMFGMGRYLYDLPNEWVEFDSQRKRITDAGLNTLMSNYKAWYARQTAQKPAVASKTQKGQNGMDQHASPPHQRLWGQGMSVFGPDWDMARPWLIAKWTEKVSPANTRNSASELSDDERDLLADYIKEKASALQKIWPNQKACILQSNGVAA